MTARPDEPAPGAPTPPLPWGPDSLVAAVLPAFPARVVAANVSGTVFEAEARHVCARLSAEVTARAAAAVILVGSDLKGEERLSMQVLSDGPLKGLLVEVDSNLRFRGYTHRKTAGQGDHDGTPHTAALGTGGRLQMIRSTGGGITYQGITALGDGDLVADVERALRDSQQIPSCLIVDHGYRRQLTHCVGLLLQALPGCDEAAFDRLAAAVRARAADGTPLPHEPEALITHLLPGLRCDILATRSVAFACRCSRERVVDMLRSLGPPEGETAYPALSRVGCVFCNDLYEIPAEELAS